MQTYYTRAITNNPTVDPPVDPSTWQPRGYGIAAALQDTTGYAVYNIDTPEDDGNNSVINGSFRWATQAQEPRIITTSLPPGTEINLLSRVTPTFGQCVADYGGLLLTNPYGLGHDLMRIRSGERYFIENLRWRRRWSGEQRSIVSGGNADGFGTGGFTDETPPRHVYLKNCTGYAGGDENYDIAGGVEDVTVDRCLFSWPVANIRYQILQASRGGGHVSYIENALMHGSVRNPRIVGSTKQTEFLNNLIYNYRTGISLSTLSSFGDPANGDPEIWHDSRVAVVGNHFLVGPDNIPINNGLRDLRSEGADEIGTNRGTTQLYETGNIPGGSSQPVPQLPIFHTGDGTTNLNRVDSPVEPLTITPLPATEVMAITQSYAGALPDQPSERDFERLALDTALNGNGSFVYFPAQIPEAPAADTSTVYQALQNNTEPNEAHYTGEFNLDESRLTIQVIQTVGSTTIFLQPVANLSVGTPVWIWGVETMQGRWIADGTGGLMQDELVDGPPVDTPNQEITFQLDF